jgi:hypothetical protein
MSGLTVGGRTRWPYRGVIWLDPADLRALNETFATIERGINNLNARLKVTMAFVAALPGADQIDVAAIEKRLTASKLEPILTAQPTRPDQFVSEAILELRRMAAIVDDLNRATPYPRPAAAGSRRVHGAE